MPADLRQHARYTGLIFQVESEIYRTFHMKDPETFYNKSVAWTVAKYTSGQGTAAQTIKPTYLIASLPDSKQPEFLQMIPFTPRNRDNMIGLMMARCDGEHLGEKVVMLMSKQEFVLGPMQVEARINQDQVISKDLTLWNQQGSQVLRGQMLVLPIDNSFLYVEPIYLQASEAKMPQLKKVVLAIGNTLIYPDTYEQALAQLGAGAPPATEKPQPPQVTTIATPPPGAPPTKSATPDPRIAEIKQHIDRYGQLMGQGKWSDAAKELEAIRALVK